MERDFKDKYLFKRGRGNGMGFALLLILIGTVFLLLNLNIIPEAYTPLFTKWPTLLIVIGLWLLIKRSYTAGIVLIAIGLFFIYPTLCAVFPGYFIDLDLSMKTYWPVLLIAGGILLVSGKFSPSHKKRHREYHRNEHESADYKYEPLSGGQNNDNYNSADYIDKNVIFGSAEQIVLSNNFKGGEGNVMFGELIIDLRRAKLSEIPDILEINVMFGSGIVYVPADWVIEQRSNAILGAFEDKRYQPNTAAEGNSRLVIKGNVMFGGAEIRN